MDDMYITLDAFEEAKQYWLESLSGDLQETLLRTDFPRSKRSDPHSLPMVLDHALYQKLTRVSKDNDLSLYVLLLTALDILIFKVSEQHDIIVASPILGDTSKDYNTCIALRNIIDCRQSFKECLFQVKTTVANGYQNQFYPTRKLIAFLGIRNKLSLFRIVLLLENIHQKDLISDLLKDFDNDLLFSFRKTGEKLEGEIEYNAALFKEYTIHRLFQFFELILNQALDNLDIPINDLEITTEQEKSQILFDFNRTSMSFPGPGTLHGLFEEQAAKTPGQPAVTTIIDIGRIALDLEKDPQDRSLTQPEYEKSCFRRNPFLFAFTGENVPIDSISGFYPGNGKEKHMLIRTHIGNQVLVNELMYKLLDYFDGTNDLKNIYDSLLQEEMIFSIYTVDGELWRAGEQTRFCVGQDFNAWVSLIRRMYLEHLVELTGFNSSVSKILPPFDLKTKTPGKQIHEPVEKPLQKFEGKTGGVLLLGDTTAAASTGLMYLAAYLRRHGIDAYCQWTDPARTTAELTENTRSILSRLHPRFVGISMKWFPHIARVMEICKIVKNFNPSIRVILGGNTASYFSEALIPSPHVDYIIQGDGEVPLLAICKGDSYIPNAITKQNGTIIRRPIQYVQDSENTSDIYLSHLEEIFAEPQDPFRAAAFYINTAKGCSFQCAYCAGCRDVTEQVFKRSKPFLRGIDQVRKDILCAKNYTAALMFDSYNLFDNMVSYYRAAWQGIDLSNHFCEFYCWELPSPEFIDLVTTTFKYVTFQIDMASFSEPHRQKLVSSGLMKPQPDDESLFIFLDRCEKYPNTEVVFNLIAGLPLITAGDLKTSERVLNRILHRYRCFKRLDWGRLHAQPGAPLVRTCKDYGMYSCASSFEEYLHYSQSNLNEEKYPGLPTLHYPFIYFNDDDLNSRISKSYFETEKKIEQREHRDKHRQVAEQTVSYFELNSRSNRLARGLIERGVKPGTIVGLLIGSSLEMAIAVLGVLKSGGAYLPIDPTYPPKRIRYILQSSGVQLLLTQGPTPGLEIPPHIVTVPINTESLYRIEDSNLSFNTGSEEPAYVIYTSGTTGRPKGVVVEHRNVVNTLVCRKAIYNMDETHTALQLFSYAFDGFVTSFFTPLLSSSRVILLGGGDARDITAIVRAIRENHITHFICIPPLYHAIITGMTGEDASSLQVVTLAGDKLSPELLELTRQKNKNLEIVNEYGVTEAAVMSTIYRHQEKSDEILIGKPTWNTALYIVNRHRQLQPIGIAGELWIAGAGTARGYLNEPELTRGSFLKPPLDPAKLFINLDQKHIINLNKSFWPHLFTKRWVLYKSGDLARWREDGNIEFLGREDTLVKIRGNRLSLSEIETYFSSHEAVKDAVVMVRQDAKGENYLCAYLVIDEDTPDPITPTYWQDYLSRELPEYMIPSHIIHLQDIPLTPNGKIDRKSLPEPKSILFEETIEEPQNEKERKLVEIWRDVLGVEKIGVNHNFFELGGHSLKAIKIISRIHQEMDIHLSIDKLFEIPTIKGLARHLGETQTQKHAPVSPVEKKEYYPASQAQKRIYILHQMEGNPTHYSAPIAVVLEGNPDIRKLENAFKSMLKRHESLRTSFHLNDSELVQRVHEEVIPSIQWIEPVNPGENESVLLHFVKPFDLSQVPLLRLGIMPLEENRHLLILDMHHIISDAVSIRVFIRELADLYEDKTLPELTLHYKDYSVWQWKMSRSDFMKKQEMYWLDRFRGKIPLIALPTDFPRPQRQGFEGSTFHFAIDKTDSRAIKEWTIREESTLQITLLAIYYILLYKVTGQEDIIVGTPTAGRRHADLENIIGIFINSLALRCYPSPDKTALQFLAEVKTNTVDAFDNQDYPFDNLVEKVLTDRPADRNPLFDVLFEISHLEDDEQIKMSHLEIKPYHYKNTIAKYDLDWVGVETQDGLKFSITYRTTLFRPETIAAFAAWFAETLHQVIENPYIQIKDITISHNCTVTQTTLFTEKEDGDFVF